jgi:O-antigen/teichoic acid export membrane protein
MTPLASKLEAAKNEGELRNVTLRATCYCMTIMLPIFLTFMIRGKSFIGLWMGSSYAEWSGHVLWILSLPWLFNAASSVAGSIMLGISRHKPIVPVVVTEGLANLGLSIVLVRSMGIFGVAWGTAIPDLCVNLLFWPWYVRKTLGIPVRKYVLSSWLRPALSAVPFAVASYFIDKDWPAPNLSAFFLQILLILPLALVSAWYVCLDSGDRRTYLQRLTTAFLTTSKKA